MNGFVETGRYADTVCQPAKSNELKIWVAYLYCLNEKAAQNTSFCVAFCVKIKFYIKINLQLYCFHKKRCIFVTLVFQIKTLSLMLHTTCETASRLIFLNCTIILLF